MAIWKINVSCGNPAISWFVPLLFLVVSFVFFEYGDVVFARMSVVDVYTVVLYLDSAFKRACGRILNPCSGLSWRRS